MSALGLLTQFGLSRRGAAPGPGEYEYYRLRITAKQGSAYVAIATLELRESAGGADVAPGNGVASASSELDGKFGPWNASKAFDGDSSTRWITTTPAPLPAWVQYKFTVKRTIVQYAIRTDSNSPPLTLKDWTLEGSNDGSTWDTLDTRSGVSWVSNEVKVFTL